MSNMSFYCMSCIICLNKIYFIYVQAQKPNSISRGLCSSDLEVRSFTMATPLGIFRAKLQLDYGGQPCHCLFIFLFFCI